MVVTCHPGSYVPPTNLTVSDPSSSINFTYDNLGRTTALTQSIAGLTPSVTFNQAFDAMSNRTELRASIGSTADFRNSYTYDTLQRLTGIVQQSQTGGNSVTAKRVAFSYNDNNWDMHCIVDKNWDMHCIGQELGHALYHMLDRRSLANWMAIRSARGIKENREQIASVTFSNGQNSQAKSTASRCNSEFRGKVSGFFLTSIVRCTNKHGLAHKQS
jgi:hypothetical protein